MTKILFICHGNICRSPMAEFVMKKLVSDANLQNEFVIDSAATSTEELGNGMHRGTLRMLQEKNIPYTNHRARQITLQDYSYYDYLVGMDEENLYYMQKKWHNDFENKISLLLSYANLNRDIADPWYTGNFYQTYDDILLGCTKLLEKIIKEKKL